MASRCGLFCLLALLTAGCERFPEDPIFAYGALQSADGTPRPGVTLAVERVETPLNPRPDEPPPAFRPYTDVVSGADGRFTLEVFSGDSRFIDLGPEQFDVRFRIATPLEEGRATWLSFNFNDDVELPPLRPWAAELARVESAQGLALTFAPPPTAPLLPPTGSLPTLLLEDGSDMPIEPTPPEPVVQLLSGGELLWQQTVEAPPWTPTPWMLEDFAAPEAQVRLMSAGIWIFTPLGAPSGSVDFRMEWRSERIAWPAGSLLPISRGAQCLPRTSTPCPWTDGRLSPAPLELEQGEGPPYDLGVELSPPVHLSRAVIRGLNTFSFFDISSKDLVVIEGSEDGVQWTRLGTAAPFRDERPSALLGQNEQWAVDSPFDAPLRTDPRFHFLDVPLQTPFPLFRLRLFVLQANGRRVPLRGLAELSLY